MSSPSPGKRRMDTDVVKLYPCAKDFTADADISSHSFPRSEVVSEPILEVSLRTFYHFPYIEITTQFSNFGPTEVNNQSLLFEI